MMIKKLSLFIAVVFFQWQCSAIAWAQKQTQTQTQTQDPIADNSPIPASVTEVKKRPKIALVLSGGGARGFAHVGVLRVLKEMRIPVDYVVGTSMGAVVGGVYASGKSVEDIENLVRQTSWDSVLADRPARDDLDFRRREEDVILPSRIEFSVTKNGFNLPPSAAGNSALEQTLIRFIGHEMKDEPVDTLPIPFRSVASDLVTGELVDLDKTPLLSSMRASLALPGMFAPVHINKRLVVDGGLVRNLPVDIAHKMGADIVIAVNVGTPLARENELGSAISVAQQMIQILTEQNVQRSIKELQPNDILISPNLDGVNFLDFDEHHNAMAAGDIAARQKYEQLRVLSLGEKEYADFESHRTSFQMKKDRVLPISKIEVVGSRSINPEILIKQAHLNVGALTTETDILKSVSKLYGRGDLEHVDVDFKENDEQREVIIKTQEAMWVKNRLRLGLELSSDFKDSHQFSLGAMHVMSSLNEAGAELRMLGKIGTQRILGVQWYQPLSPASPWYIAPSLESNSNSIDIFSHGKRDARIAYKNSSMDWVFGRRLGDWGAIHLGVERAHVRIEPIVPENFIGTYKFYQTNQFIHFGVDTLDSLAFPTRGVYMNVNWEKSLVGARKYFAIGGGDVVSGGEAAGVNLDATSNINSSFIGMKALQAGDWAGHIYAEWARSQGEVAPLSLGGFLRLSGTPRDSLSNKTVALGRVVFARRIGYMPAALGGAVRLGMSAELGGGFARGESVKFDKIQRSGSMFLSFDTRFGPLYLGAGSTYKVGSSFYLFLGPIW